MKFQTYQIVEVGNRNVKVISLRHGISVTLVSDGATYFASSEFKQFSVEWDFQDVVTSANFPRSNGKAESAVKRTKKIFIKCSPREKYF